MLFASYNGPFVGKKKNQDPIIGRVVSVPLASFNVPMEIQRCPCDLGSFAKNTAPGKLGTTGIKEFINYLESDYC